LSALAFVVVLLLLDLNTPEGGWREKLAQMDWMYDRLHYMDIASL